MSYPILDPSRRAPSLASKCALAVMAKAPRPGKVKTRLSPPLTLEQTAALNVCFLRDTAQNIAQVTASGKAAGLISYTPIGDEALFDGLMPKDFSLVLQREDGFGERLLCAATDILACGFGAVCLIDSDSPTVPTAAFQKAVDALQAPGNRIVLGGSDDGGYYLIGMKQPHPEPFKNITWSTASVYAETVSAIMAAGIEFVELPLWYDVDDAATLKTLNEELLEGVAPPFAVMPGYFAPHSKEFLAKLRTSGENFQ
jgi:rSAM/selenodomain-associated transferase 1